MTESKKRQFHSPELKAKVALVALVALVTLDALEVLEALGEMKTLNQIAHEYGVHPVLVGQWTREIQARAKSLFEGKRRPQEVHETSRHAAAAAAAAAAAGQRLRINTEPKKDAQLRFAPA